MASRKKVLIVAHSDGFIQVYAADDVDIHFINAPEMHSPEGERMAELYVTKTIPYPYRQLYAPGKCRKTAQVQATKPSDIMESNFERDCLRSADHANLIIDGFERLGIFCR